MPNYAPWSFDGGGEMKDPINLSLQIVDSIGRIDDLIREMTNVLIQEGWDTIQKMKLQARPPAFISFAERQFLHIGDDEYPQDVQLIREIVQPWNILRGLSAVFRRYHVRIWQVPSTATLMTSDGPTHFPMVASAHLESNVGLHRSISFEVAEKAFARALRRVGWTIEFDAIPLGNQIWNPPNNGYATLVLR